jgi:recombination protein RecA
MASNESKTDRALEMALQRIEKSFGKGAVMQLGKGVQHRIECIPSGALSLDIATGGGIPRGRITEIYGPESGGKTTLALTIIAQAQKAGGLALFVDAEHALDVEYARALGVDVDRLYVAQPTTGEEALNIMDSMVESGAMDIVVLDSVAALVPKAELEGDMGDAHVGIQARMMSQALRKLGGSISKTRTCVIFINQIREKIGVMFGNPETTPGGRALKFWASVRLEVRRGELLKNGTDAYGARTKVKVVKNKVAPPFKQAEFDMIFGKGISASGDLLDLAVENDIVSKAGTYYNYKDTRLGQGRDNAKTFLDDNPEVFAELDQAVRAVIAPPKTDVDPAIVAAIEE